MARNQQTNARTEGVRAIDSLSEAKVSDGTQHTPGGKATSKWSVRTRGSGAGS